MHNDKPSVDDVINAIAIEELIERLLAIPTAGAPGEAAWTAFIFRVRDELAQRAYALNVLHGVLVSLRESLSTESSEAARSATLTITKLLEGEGGNRWEM